MKLHHYCAPLLIAFAGTAHAGTVPALKKLADTKSIAAAVDGEYLSYSGPFGSRRIVNGTTRVDLGKTSLSLGVSQGTRKASGDRFNATRISATLVHDWSARLSTRTSASIANNQPVFVTRDFVQEVSYKPLPQTVLTVGGRYSRYFGGLDGTSWSVGAAQYFGGGMVGYRFSSYNVQHLGHTTGHLVNFKVNDPLGSNQLWLGHGTALHDATWLATPEKGKFSSVELRRVQPIGGGVSLMLGVNRIWYNTDNAKYHGTGARVGLIFAE
jgi:YaiO family outer membrane protein